MPPDLYMHLAGCRFSLLKKVYLRLKLKALRDSHSAIYPAPVELLLF